MSGVDADVGGVVVDEEDSRAVDTEVGAGEGGVGARGNDGAEGADGGVALGALEEADKGVEDLGEAEVGLGGADGDEVR